MTSSHNITLRWLLTAVAIVLVALIVLASLRKPDGAEVAARLIAAEPSEIAFEAATAEAATPTSVPRLAVDMIGAVRTPGVYYLESTARVVDAVEAAGGLAPDADRDAINLAAAVVDGQQIRVPRVGDAPSEPRNVPVESAQSALININQADAAALDGLPGIGPVTAQAIVEFRGGNGPFTRIEDIQNVKGIGPALFAKIKDQITVDK